MFNYTKTKKTDFLLLNDIIPNEISLQELAGFISQYMDCAIYDIDELIGLLKLPMIDSEIVAIGDGGELMSKKLLAEGGYKQLTIYRKWQDGNYEFHYDTPSSFLNSDSVQVIDDVVASGETLWKVREILDPSQTKTFSATVLVTSGNLNSKYRSSDGGLPRYDNLTSALLVLSNSKDDPYWYPAIYSMRHLLFKQEQNPHYLERISKKYFNGNLSSLERALESLKSMYLNYSRKKVIKF